MTTLVYDWN